MLKKKVLKTLMGSWTGVQLPISARRGKILYIFKIFIFYFMISWPCSKKHYIIILKKVKGSPKNILNYFSNREETTAPKVSPSPLYLLYMLKASSRDMPCINS